MFELDLKILIIKFNEMLKYSLNKNFEVMVKVFDKEFWFFLILIIWLCVVKIRVFYVVFNFVRYIVL